MFRLLRDRNFLKISTIIIVISLLYPLVSYRIKIFQHARLKTQDIFFNLRYKLKPSLPNLNKIVVISIDDQSTRALNMRWPWTRDVFAVLVEKLKKHNATVLCIDLAFVGRSGEVKTDEFLAREMKDAGNVVIASYFSKSGKYVLPDKSIKESAHAFGFINKPRDIDYSVRRTRPVMMSVKGDAIDYSFALKAAAVHLGIPLESIKYDPADSAVMFGLGGPKEKYKIKLTKKYHTTDINYIAKPDSFKVVSFWRVITDRVNPDMFDGKIVLVGMTAEVFHDIYHTPFGLMPGVFINANEVLMFINKSFIKHVSGQTTLWLLLILGIIILVATYRFGLARGLFTVITLLAIGFSANLYLLSHNYSWDFFGMFFIAVSSYLITYAYKNIGLLIDNMILRKEAATDGLTGLYAYRYFELKLRNELKRARELKSTLSLIILDIDHFKKVNDTYGHEEGNIVLKELADILNASSRKTDTACRYGGEEFCVILPDVVPENAVKYAWNLKDLIEAHDFVITKGVLKLTISVGVASDKEDVYGADKLIKRADAALYRAKEAGRNRVILFS